MTYFPEQSHMSWSIKGQEPGHKYKENDSARPDIRCRTIIASIMNHLIQMAHNIPLKTNVVNNVIHRFKT